MENYQSHSNIIPYIFVIVVFVLIIMFVLVLIQIRTQKKLYKVELLKGSEKLQYQQNLLQTIIKVQEEERKRIARIVHDDLGNKINLISILIQSTEIKDSESKQIILNQLPLLSVSARNIAHDLYPVEIEYMGLTDVINELQMSLSSSIYVNLYLNEANFNLDIETEIQVYRILQEFINNVLKYASADELFISLRRSQKYLSIVLQDNGVGFDLKNVKKGMGMNNIEYRVNFLSGIFKWKSQLDKGVKLIIRLPYETEN